MQTMQKALIKRLHALLTFKESAANVPRNLEARRRLQYFTNSLFMQMPAARPVSEMLSFRSKAIPNVFKMFVHLFVLAKEWFNPYLRKFYCLPLQCIYAILF